MVRLAEVRKELGFSQKELADLAGVSVSTVSGIEVGRHTAHPSTLRKLANAMDVPITEITRGPMVTFQMPSGAFGLVSTEDLKRLQQQQEK